MNAWMGGVVVVGGDGDDGEEGRGGGLGTARGKGMVSLAPGNELMAEEERADVLKLLLYELNCTIAPRAARIEAIHAVLEELDHSDEYKHDEELDLQADKILFQRLALAHSVYGGPSGEEVGLVASALEMIYRASRARVALSFNEVGEVMLPLLVEMVRDPHLDSLPSAVVDVSSASASASASASVSVSVSSQTLTAKDEEAKRTAAAAAVKKKNGDVGIKTSINGFGGVPDDDTCGDDAYHEEKKGDSMDNLVQFETPVGEMKRTIGGAVRGWKEEEEEEATEANDCHPEENGDGSSHAKVEYAAQYGGDNPVHRDDEEGSKPHVRFNEQADMRRVPEDQPDKMTSLLAVSMVLKVLRYFSRVLSAMIPMAHHPGLLDALVYQLGRRREDEDAAADVEAGAGSGSGSIVRPGLSARFVIDEDDPDEHRSPYPALCAREGMTTIRVDAMATVVNLACAEENKILMAYHAGLLDAVLHAANEDPSEEAREHAAIVLMNLAYSDDNKVHMAGQDYLLDTLVRLVGDQSPFTRRYASAALFTLACAVPNTSRMVRHDNGVILTSLVRVLRGDPIDEARINAAEALFSMARNNDSDDDTVLRMGNHPELLEGLARAVVSDYSADVRAYAARALEWLAADLHYPMNCHKNLLSAITMASRWTKTTCIAEALKTQSMIPDNRAPMVRHPGLLDALAELALLDGISDEEVSLCAITALQQLTNEESTRRLMIRNEGVMTALTKATFSKSGLDGSGEGAGTDTVESFNGSSAASGVSTSQMTKNALKNLADAL